MMEASEGVKQDLETRILPIARESSDPEKRLMAQISGGAAFPAFFLRIVVITIAVLVDDKYGYICGTSVRLAKQYHQMLLWAALAWALWTMFHGGACQGKVMQLHE